MKIAQVMLHIAKAELATIEEYSELINNCEDATEVDRSIIDEIMGDEFNHSLIASLTAARLMNIKIATDDISTDPNKIEVK